MIAFSLVFNFFIVSSSRAVSCFVGRRLVNTTPRSPNYFNCNRFARQITVRAFSRSRPPIKSSARQSDVIKRRESSGERKGVARSYARRCCCAIVFFHYKCFHATSRRLTGGVVRRITSTQIDKERNLALMLFGLFLLRGEIKIDADSGSRLTFQAAPTLSGGRLHQPRR